MDCKKDNKTGANSPIRPNMNFRRAWWESIAQLPAEERMQAYDAVMNYAFCGTSPDILPVSVQEIWARMIPAMVDSRRKWLYHSKMESLTKEIDKDKEEKERSKEIDEKEKDKDEQRAREAKQFSDELRLRFPRVAAMPEPLTHEQYLKLRRGMDANEILHLLSRLNAYTRREYKSAYRTLICWANRQERDFQKAEKDIIG